jgi:hypothetical protein
MTGSCLCGAVAYELEGPPVWAHNCHCQRCRKARGAAFASNLFVPIDALRYTRGEALVERYRPPDAERFTSCFCRVCGSPLPYRNEPRDVAVVPMGSLDDDPGLTPRAHIYVGSKAPWFTISDALPQHEEQRPR